jgi:hypothetical protein
LEEIEESRAREMMRIQKVRVAMGDLDVVGQDVWDHVGPRPRMGRVVSESVLNRPSPAYRFVDPGRPEIANNQPTIRKSGFGDKSELAYDLLDWYWVHVICYDRHVARDK